MACDSSSSCQPIIFHRKQNTGRCVFCADVIAHVFLFILFFSTLTECCWLASKNCFLLFGLVAFECHVLDAKWRSVLICSDDKQKHQCRFCLVNTIKVHFVVWHLRVSAFYLVISCCIGIQPENEPMYIQQWNCVFDLHLNWFSIWSSAKGYRRIR